MMAAFVVCGKVFLKVKEDASPEAVQAFQDGLKEMAGKVRSGQFWLLRTIMNREKGSRDYEA